MFKSLSMMKQQTSSVNQEGITEYLRQQKLCEEEKGEEE